MTRAFARAEAAGGSGAASFRRVKSEEWVGKKGSMDNTYEGTFGESGWGARAQAVLGQVCCPSACFCSSVTKRRLGPLAGATGTQLTGMLSL